MISEKSPFTERFATEKTSLKYFCHSTCCSIKEPQASTHQSPLPAERPASGLRLMFARQKLVICDPGFSHVLTRFGRNSGDQSSKRTGQSDSHEFASASHKNHQILLSGTFNHWS